MFKEMQLSITAEVEKLIPHIGAGAFAQAEQKLREVKDQAMEISGVTKNADESAKVQSHTPTAGRNDQCPCGSGKKYKKCCGK
jgi:preprotein translocase subunit SecA